MVEITAKKTSKWLVLVSAIKKLARINPIKLIQIMVFNFISFFISIKLNKVQEKSISKLSRTNANRLQKILHQIGF